RNWVGCSGPSVRPNTVKACAKCVRPNWKRPPRRSQSLLSPVEPHPPRASLRRLEDLIARQMVRLDTGPKRLLDAVKVVARNVFYRALAPFKAAYDNYRDDHEHFR